MSRILLFAFAAVLFTACSRTSYPTTPSPVPGDPRYPEQSRRYPDQNPYPNDSRTYPQDYPREGQTDGVVTIIRTGNNNYEKMPPGQAKKKYGGKSAKVYAPGQQKKNGNNYNIATVISVPDAYASRANSGQLFYVYRGNTYWKQNHGYYHIEDRNNNSTSAKGKGKKKNKNRNNDDD
jgi:hypothetical protein